VVDGGELGVDSRDEGKHTGRNDLVLPFWYWLMQVVLEKRPLNGCSSSIVVSYVVYHMKHTFYETGSAVQWGRS